MLYVMTVEDPVCGELHDGGASDVDVDCEVAVRGGRNFDRADVLVAEDTVPGSFSREFVRLCRRHGSSQLMHLFCFSLFHHHGGNGSRMIGKWSIP